MTSRYRRPRRRRVSYLPPSVWERTYYSADYTVSSDDTELDEAELSTLTSTSAGDVMRLRGYLEISMLLRDTTTSSDPILNHTREMHLAIGLTPSDVSQTESPDVFSYKDAKIWRRYRMFVVTGYPRIYETKMPNLVMRPEQSLIIAMWQERLGNDEEIVGTIAFRGWSQEVRH